METVTWTPFECDGQPCEYIVVPTETKTSPPGWPAHKASPGKAGAILQVVVRKRGSTHGVGMGYPSDTNITIEHAIETARFFSKELGT